MNRPTKKKPLTIKRIILILAVLLVSALVRQYLPETTDSGNSPEPQATSELTVEAAAKDHLSEVMLDASGLIHNVLPDDNEGSRHQRFILELESGHTVLVAHNIDLAPRVPLNKGDRVNIHGQYEWNDRGGVLHGTHGDPANRHEGGWIDHNGKRYQ